MSGEQGPQAEGRVRCGGLRHLSRGVAGGISSRAGVEVAQEVAIAGELRGRRHPESLVVRGDRNGILRRFQGKVQTRGNGNRKTNVLVDLEVRVWADQGKMCEDGEAQGRARKGGREVE